MFVQPKQKKKERKITKINIFTFKEISWKTVKCMKLTFLREIFTAFMIIIIICFFLHCGHMSDIFTKTNHLKFWELWFWPKFVSKGWIQISKAEGRDHSGTPRFKTAAALRFAVRAQASSHVCENHLHIFWGHVWRLNPQTLWLELGGARWLRARGKTSSNRLTDVTSLFFSCSGDYRVRRYRHRVFGTQQVTSHPGDSFCRWGRSRRLGNRSKWLRAVESGSGGGRLGCLTFVFAGTWRNVFFC